MPITVVEGVVHIDDVPFDGTVVEDVLRTDVGELGPSERTDEGYLRVEAFVARPGILEYLDGSGGTRKELVLPETLADAAHLDSLRLKPVTLGHPNPGAPTPERFLDSENIAEWTVGTTGETVDVAEDGRVRVRMAIQRADAIEAVEAGTRYNSEGYRCALVMQSGVHPVYGEYDAIQVRRRGNHVALTRTPRAGDQAYLRLDSSCYDAANDGVDNGDHMDRETLIQHFQTEHGLSAADAERLADSPAEFVAAAAKVDALPSEDDLKAARIADRKARRPVAEIAAEMKLDGIDELDLDELKAAILAKAEVEVPKNDSIDDDAMLAATWEVFVKTRQDHVDDIDDGDEEPAEEPAAANVPRLDTFEGAASILSLYAPKAR